MNANSWAEILASILILLGTLFSIGGMVGFLRLPDIYMRLHAIGKVGGFGVAMLSLAASLVLPAVWSKLLALAGFIVVVGPVVTHAISGAAYTIKLPMTGAVQDDLEKQAESADR
jgi:multicomponent Na+:H+ antiporter subunit G